MSASSVHDPSTPNRAGSSCFVLPKQQVPWRRPHETAANAVDDFGGSITLHTFAVAAAAHTHSNDACTVWSLFMSSKHCCLPSSSVSVSVQPVQWLKKTLGDGTLATRSRKVPAA